MIRDEKEIRRARRLLEEAEEEMEEIIVTKDCFKQGYLMGKLAVLDWVCGGPAGPVSCHYDYEDWHTHAYADDPTVTSHPDPTKPPDEEQLIKDYEWLKDDHDMEEDEEEGE